MTLRSWILILGIASLIGRQSLAQEPIGAVALADLVQGLGVNTRVLIIGAHPDDEDTSLLTWLARGRHVETAYLSLTRGEGGQNLIGNELGYALGQIRTEELLAARRIDGAHQYFTRAVDFGYSKSFAETDSLWPHEMILKDVVTVIRAFRPHVIVSMWTGTPIDGHGHHTYAGVISREAFAAAADGNRFPTRTTAGLGPWSASKFYQSTAYRADSTTTLRFNVGEYSPIFGRSFAELAALSRSKHLSQGQGMLLPLGVYPDGVRLDSTRVALATAPETSIFDGIDTSWTRFANVKTGTRAIAPLASLGPAIRDARLALALASPDSMVPALARVVDLARAARDGLGCTQYLVPQCASGLADLAWALNTTVERASKALIIAAGVTIDATSDREQVAIRDSVDVTVTLYNRGKLPIQMTGGAVIVEKASTPLGAPMAPIPPDSTVRFGGRVKMDAVTYPWWLLHGVDDKRPIYDLQDGSQGIIEEMILGDDRLMSSSVEFTLRIGGTDVKAVAGPIVYRYADPSRGEQRRPLAGVPKIQTVFQSSVEYIKANTPADRTARVVVHSAWSRPDTLNVALNLPAGLRADSAERRVVLPAFGTASVYFKIHGTVKQALYKVKAQVNDNVGLYQQGFIEINYDHVRPVRYYLPPELYLSAVEVKTPEKLEVAYVRGVGDNIEPMLEQVGIKVKYVAPEALPVLSLTAYNALLIGPRAYDAIQAVAANAAAVLDFARHGGTVVVQFGQDPTKPSMLPYPVALATPPDRVTDERAAVVFLDSMAQILRTPNRITVDDFKGWGQERALYMPRTIDPRYQRLFSMHDKGEPDNSGALLVAPLGKGVFVYTTLSFFRQLPGGNPGAMRLFVNLLSAGMKAGPVPK